MRLYKILNVIGKHRNTITIPGLDTKNSSALSPILKCFQETNINNKTIMVQSTTMISKVSEDSTKILICNNVSTINSPN